MVFDFYDDRLFRVTVDYDRKHTEGLIDADMIEALSAVYGSPVIPIVARSRALGPVTPAGLVLHDLQAGDYGRAGGCAGSYRCRSRDRAGRT
jgi:hypothetical protein